MTYNRMKLQITRGAYTREEALDMLDVFLMNHRITAAQYNELAAMLPAEEVRQCAHIRKTTALLRTA